MNTDNKQKAHVLKKFFSILRTRVSLSISICLMLLFSIALIASLFFSERTLRKIEQSQYLKSKVNKALEHYEITSEGLISIKLNKFGRANVKIERVTFSNLSDFVAQDINLKVDFIKYWLGLTFIDEVFVTKVMYGLPNNFSKNFNKTSGLDLKFLTKYLYEPINKINSKSINVENGVLIFQNQKYEFKNINVVKNEKFLTTKASFSIKPTAKKTASSATINLLLEESNVLNFNIDLQENDYWDFSYFKKLSEIVPFFPNLLIKDGDLKKEKKNEIKFAGIFDLNSTKLSFELIDLSRSFKVNSTINVLNSFKKRSLLFRKTELALRGRSLLLSDLKIDLNEKTFDTKIKFLSSNANSFGFLDDLTIKGFFSDSEGTKTKIKMLGANPSNFKAILEIRESANGLDSEEKLFDFRIQLDAFQNSDLDKLGAFFPFFPIKENRGIKISDAEVRIFLKFRKEYVELNSFDGKINKLFYLQKDVTVAKFENIALKGNSKQTFVSINSVKTTVEPLINSYKDIKIELGSTKNVEQERGVKVTFKSKVVDLISLIPIPKHSSTWIEFFTRSQEEKEVLVTYSKVIALTNIENFFTIEEPMFELNVKNLSIPINADNTINLETLDFKGIGNTVFFDGVMAANKDKISGSVQNALPYILSKGKAGNLIVSIDSFNSKKLFPNFLTFITEGSIKITLLPNGIDNNTFMLSDINLTKANVYIPALALKKMKGNFSQLKFHLTKDNKSNFEYSQNNVLVSGKAVHKSIFEINKVNYSIIKTPDVFIKKATFKKYGKYNQFKTNKGTISLDFLTRLSIKKKQVPLDLVFSNIGVTLNGNIFLDSLKGELRSFDGLRGYAKAKLSPQSNFEVIISPRKNNAINLVISGNDAGELLRRGDYYRNGYGGMFKASILYKNKTNLKGSLEIQEFRIKNAPILAQIISSASIIGLMDNLNGNGLLFTKIEGSFDYKGDKLTLKDGVAVGPSLGLTMGGFERYGNKENLVDVNGLVSPVYIINGVVKAIPLIGKVLGGEKGEGVFGVSYKVQGNSSNPSVSVNPLSILTPGVFRKIFSIDENGNK